jgi:protein-L-isoaspartate(D-aspartate) O-methyltransferase
MNRILSGRIVPTILLLLVLVGVVLLWAVLSAGDAGGGIGRPAVLAQDVSTDEAPSEDQAPEDAAAEGTGPGVEEEAGAADEGEGDAEEETPPVWDRPRFDEQKTSRLKMVREQIAGRLHGRTPVKNKDVLEAMRQVPRHRFVPVVQIPRAYGDYPLPIGYGQTISQPYIVGLMTEMLKLKPGEKVLEIGTGSGYQAAVLSELTPHVFTIEIVEELAQQAEKRLTELGYKTIEVRQGDGYTGWEEHAPFDGIIVTAAARHIPPPLLKQLKPGGRMSIPVGGVFEVQSLLLVRKDEEGALTTESVLPVRFVPLTGRVLEGEREDE